MTEVTAVGTGLDQTRASLTLRGCAVPFPAVLADIKVLPVIKVSFFFY